MPEWLDALKAIIAGAEAEPAPAPAPAPVVTTAPALESAPAPVVTTAPAPAPEPNAEIEALKAQQAEQAEALKLLAQRPVPGTPPESPTPTKLPKLFDTKALETRIEAEMKDNKSLDYHWTEENPISPPDQIVVGRGGPDLL